MSWGTGPRSTYELGGGANVLASDSDAPVNRQFTLPRGKKDYIQLGTG